jgi:L-asparaginase
MSSPDPLPRIALIVTGGTIDAVGADRLDLAWYLDTGKWLPPGGLLAQIPEVGSFAQVEEVPFRRVPSHALVDRDWLDLASLITDLFVVDRADGVVITHGTNTLEETAYFLDLTVRSDRPIVVVGAMRPASALSGDGPLNLLNAIRVAAAPQSRGAGALVVLNDTIFAARDVTKGATYRVNAFEARDLGPLGYADADGSVVYYHRSMRRHTADSEFELDQLLALDALPRVDVVMSHVNADGSLVDAAVASGARGIVSAGTGAGAPTPRESEALSRAASTHVIVGQASRVGAGRSARGPSLVQRGFVASDNLQPAKARLLLSLALTRTRDPDEIQRMFDTY